MDLQNKISRSLNNWGKYYPTQKVTVDLGEDNIFSATIKKDLFASHSYLVTAETKQGDQEMNVKEEQIVDTEEPPVKEEEEKTIRNVSLKVEELETKVKALDTLAESARTTLLNKLETQAEAADKDSDKAIIETLTELDVLKSSCTQWIIKLSKVSKGELLKAEGQCECVKALAENFESGEKNITEFLKNTVEKSDADIGAWLKSGISDIKKDIETLNKQFDSIK